MMTTLMRPLDVVRPQLLDLSRALDEAAVGVVFEVARRSTTWTRARR